MFNKDDGFKQNFMDFVNLRTEERTQGEEYDAAIREASALRQEIKEALPPDKKKLISMYDEAGGVESGLRDDDTYLKGLRDGVRLARLLNDTGHYNLIPQVGRVTSDNTQEKGYCCP